MRCAASAPTRPAFTSRRSRSRICARCNGWRSGFPRPGLTAEIDGIGNVLGTSTKPGPKLLAGSHLESQNYAGWLDGPLGVVYALEAARVINADPDANGAVEVAAWCDEEGHFGSFLGTRSYVGALTEADIDAARDRNSGRTMRDALRDIGLAGRARARLNAGGMSDISRRISNRARRSKAAASRSASSLPSSGSGSTGSLSQASKITPAPRGWRPQGRRPGAGEILRRNRRAFPGGLRTAHGMDHRPHHPRSRRAQHHPGRGGNAVPDSRRRSRCDRSAGGVAAGHGRGSQRKQGRCTVAVERIRTGAPALMDAAFQHAIEAASEPVPAAGRSACPAAPVTTPRFSRPSCRQACCSCPRSAASVHHWTENTADADIVTGAEVFVDACRRLLAR